MNVNYKRIRNHIIKQKINVTRSLLEDIKNKQLKWYGHVQRMEEGRLTKKVMKWSPPGRRKWLLRTALIKNTYEIIDYNFNEKWESD